MGNTSVLGVRSYLPQILKTQVDFLLFRPAKPDLDRHFAAYLAYIVIVTLTVGVGRYWDHLDAEPWQYFGLGSVAYIFVLSAFLYLILLPLKPKNWSYRTVLVFVGLTSLPALLYAVPVERFFTLTIAQSLNAWFLAAVAAWRVALYIRFLRGVAGFSGTVIAVALLLPLSAILVLLSFLNLEHAVFEIMAGNPGTPGTPGDQAYFVVLFLSIFAYITFPITLALYLYHVYRGFKHAARTDT